ncbi:acyl-CoA dehydrogenase [Thauera chlorobenzoica]|uniref:Butyryl-CoA dehydrogenase n=1 Tax=Thauera chlorobenzoica TaxID=96773 RepID=A0A1H5YTH5_9RHOO|nr:acyl-CoA dehydrogenase [Thauera chlorobenzoica]APR06208.1 Butyryl-CoA dehydrogenase [Thauera chlorobenzoica]SEG27268.1 Acyl-CoA dehydrogenase [Thauera chlorobenzoica]
MREIIFDAMEQLLGDCCSPNHVRRIERGEGGPKERAVLWRALQESGFTDALVAEARGGSGLSLSDAYPIAFVAGRHALPLPLMQTILVRGIMSETNAELPEGSITIAGDVSVTPDGTVVSNYVPFGEVADWVLVDFGDRAQLLPATGAQRHIAGGYGSVNARMRWTNPSISGNELPGSHWRAYGACLISAMLAGAMERTLNMTMGYANDRVQFGRPIAKLQIIQQQVSVMAEQVFAARMAAQVGFSTAGTRPKLMAAAVAKQRTSEAVGTVSSIAHSVHGAMGFTEEYDLQLFTRRMHEWRLAYGTEVYWSKIIGRELLAAGESRTLDFVRQSLAG